PIASVIVISAGRPSGITETAMPTTAWNASTKGRSRYHPTRMPRFAIMPDVPSHAAQITTVTGEPLLVGRLVIIDGPIDASPEPLNSAPQVKPIKPMFDAPVQPLTGHQPHGVLPIRENGELGGGPTSGAAESETNPLT